MNTHNQVSDPDFNVEPYDELENAPQGKGRFVIFTIIVLFVLTCMFFTWNSFFRYEVYGLVDANVVRVFAPFTGTIETMAVSKGDDLKKGQMVAIITNSDNTRELERVQDSIRVAFAKIESKKSEIAWRLANNSDVFYKAKSELGLLQGKLAEYEVRLKTGNLDVKRVNELYKKGSISGRELEQVESDRDALIGLITWTQRSIDAMEERLELSKPSITDNGAAQLIPLQKELDLLYNNELRIKSKIVEGFIKSPVSGRVSDIMSYQGERIINQALFSVVEVGSSIIVLYYKADKKIPQVGDVLQVDIPSTRKTIDVEVVGLAIDTVVAPDQIKVHYRQNEKLVRVFLMPINFDVNELIVGSVVLNPFNW